MASVRERFMKAVTSLATRSDALPARLKVALGAVADVTENDVPQSERKRWAGIVAGIAASGGAGPWAESLGERDAAKVALTILRIHHLLILTR